MTEKQQTWLSLQDSLGLNESKQSSSKKEKPSTSATEAKSNAPKINKPKVQPEPSVKSAPKQQKINKPVKKKEEGSSVPKTEGKSKTVKKTSAQKAPAKKKTKEGSSSGSVKKLPKNVKQLDHITAGNKNNPYAVPNGKKQEEANTDTNVLQTIVSSEQTKKVVKKADKAVGKAYRKAKSLATKEKKEKAKKQKHTKYKQDFTQTMVPIKEIKYGIIMTTTGQYVKILEILPIDYFSFTPTIKNRIIETYKQIFQNTTKEIHLKVINDTNNPKRLTDYIKQRCEEEKYQRGLSQKVIDCAQDKINHINELSDNVSITSRFFLIYKYEGNSDDINEIYAELEGNKQHFMNVFRQIGNPVIDYDSLSEETFQTADILYYFFNRTTSRSESLQERINRVVSDCNLYNASHPDKRNVYDGDFLACKGMKFVRSDYIFEDGVYKTWLGIKRDSFPSRAYAAWINNFSSYGAGNELDVYIKKLPKQTVRYLLGQKSKLDRNLAPMKAQSTEKYKAFLPRAQNTAKILDALDAGDDLFQVVLIITLTADTLKGLRFLKQSVVKSLDAQRIFTEDSWQYTREYYNATLPLMEMPASLLTRLNHNFLTSSLQTLYPFTAFELCDHTGYVLGTRQGAIPSIVAFNNFNTKIATNANMILVGSSGSGKTYSSEILARSMRVTGIRTMFILPVKGYEYERGCNAIDGSFIRLRPGHNDCINIMEIRPEQSIDRDALSDDTAYAETSLLTKKIAFLTTFIQLLNANREFTPEIFSTMSSVLTKLYATFDITEDNDSIWADKKKRKLKPMPHIVDMYDAFQEVTLLEGVATILKEFTSGAFRNFNRDTNVDLDNKYICFDVDEQEIQKKYLPALLYIAFDCCYGLVKQNRLSKDMIFFDEVWKMLVTESAAEQVKDIAKLIRGYGGGVAFATQELNDFMSNTYGASIMANCDTRLILKLKDNELPIVTKHIVLSEEEQADIIGFDRGMGLLLAGRNRVRINISASQKEDRDFTTDPNKLKQYAEQEAAAAKNNLPKRKKIKAK